MKVPFGTSEAANAQQPTHSRQFLPVQASTQQHDGSKAGALAHHVVRPDPSCSEFQAFGCGPRAEINPLQLGVGLGCQPSLHPGPTWQRRGEGDEVKPQPEGSKNQEPCARHSPMSPKQNDTTRRTRPIWKLAMLLMRFKAWHASGIGRELLR